MILCDGPRKTADDESLARDEGGGRIPRLREATYKTVQGCLLRTTPATATIFFSVSYYQQTRIDDFDLRRGCGVMRTRCWRLP